MTRDDRARLWFYDIDTAERWGGYPIVMPRTVSVPRVGDRIRSSANRVAVVVSVEWFWPGPGSYDYDHGERGPVVDIRVRDEAVPGGV